MSYLLKIWLLGWRFLLFRVFSSLLSFQVKLELCILLLIAYKSIHWKILLLWTEREKKKMGWKESGSNSWCCKEALRVWPGSFTTLFSFLFWWLVVKPYNWLCSFRYLLVATMMCSCPNGSICMCLIRPSQEKESWFVTVLFRVLGWLDLGSFSFEDILTWYYSMLAALIYIWFHKLKWSIDKFIMLYVNKYHVHWYIAASKSVEEIMKSLNSFWIAMWNLVFKTLIVLLCFSSLLCLCESIVSCLRLLLQKHTKVEDVHLKRLREDLQSRIDFLQKQANVSIRFLGPNYHFLDDILLIWYVMCPELWG